MLLGEIFPKETIVLNLDSTEKDELFEELVEAIHNYCPELDRAEALNCLNDRESKMTTGIMHNVGIPHALVSSMNHSVGAIGISRSGIDYDSLDNAPVYVVFMILGAENETERHIQILKSLATVLQLPDFVSNLMKQESASDVFKFISSAEASLLE